MHDLVFPCRRSPKYVAAFAQNPATCADGGRRTRNVPEGAVPEGTESQEARTRETAPDPEDDGEPPGLPGPRANTAVFSASSWKVLAGVAAVVGILVGVPPGLGPAATIAIPLPRPSAPNR